MRIASLPCIALCAPLLSASPGCSFVYDADDVVVDLDPDVGVPGDGGGPDASPWDAAPPAFAVEAIEPASVFEGEGSAGAPIPVVFRGELLSGDLDIQASDNLVTVESVVAGESGALAAAAIRVDVDEELGPSDAAEVELTITRNGEESDTVTLEVAGLDELALSGTTEVSESTFDDLYSAIEIEESFLTGPAAARLVATSSITLSQKLDASGGQSARLEPGVGSCAGGEGGSSLSESGDPGSCAGGGGGGTGGGSGGGGAGHVEAGSSGDGSESGEAGDEHGNKMITPLGGEGGLGSGGGGGHAGTLESGGDGGGGGGVLELESWGDVAINDTVDADGADGGSEGCGGGGGGAGGALLVRAGGSLRAAGGTLSAAGGAGGASDGSSCEKGGGAADGRIRIDATSLSLPGDLDFQPEPIRGPMWRDEPPVIVRNHTVTIEFIAERGFPYRAAVGGTLSDDIGEPGSTDSGEIAVELEEGMNEVCLRIPQDFEQDEPESENCRSVAYVP